MVSMAKVACSEIEPLGSKYPNSRVSRSKNHSEYGFWDLEPYYLGTFGPFGWTRFPSNPLRIRVPFFLLFGFNKGTQKEKG